MHGELPLRLVVTLQLAVLAGGTATLFAHALLARLRSRYVSRRLTAARQGLTRALAGRTDGEAAREFFALSPRLQVRLLGELAPQLSGDEQRTLRMLAHESRLTAWAARLCGSPWWWRRLRGARLLTMLGGGTPAMRPLLVDRDPRVRAQAAQWAVHRPDGDVVALLLEALDSGNGHVCFAAQDALVRIGHPAVGPLRRYLEGRRGTAALAALDVAITLADPSLLTAAEALVDTDSAAVRARAVALLGAIGGARGTRRLQTALDDADPLVRMAALRAIGGLRHWPAVTAVARRLEDPVWDVRREAAVTLRACGAPGALCLRRVREHGSGGAAEVARYALDLPARGAA
jgi:hypothetical protein